MTDHFEQSASGMMILLVNLQMLVELVNTEGENRDLNLGRAGVALVGRVFQDDLGLLFLLNHDFSTFQIGSPGAK